MTSTTGSWGRYSRELAPRFIELMSMGMGGLILWWIEDATVSRAAVLDALTTAWARLLA